MQKKIIYFFLLVCLLPALLLAGNKGRVKGKITDLQTGEPLIGANVIIDGTSQGATSDANGEYSILNVDAGTYKLRASFIGYQTVTVDRVRVSGDLTSEQNFALPGEGITTATVSIVATKPLVNKDNTNAIRVTTSDDIQAMPVRGINNLLATSAGVVIKDNVVHVRGGRFDEVGFYLEGVTVTDPVAGGRGVTLNQDALEEIQVQAGGYTAEFGGANSGIIRQSLKTGGSQLKASVEYITDNITFKSKKNAFDGKKRLGAYWYGYDELSAVLSGPVFDNTVKFFGNFNYVYNRDPNPQPFPGISMGKIGDSRTGDTVNFVYPAGPVMGSQQRTFSYIGTLSIDLKPVMLRLSGTYSNIRTDVSGTTIASIFNSRVGINNRNNGMFNVKMTHVISPDMYYELTGGYYLQNREIYDPYLKTDIWGYGDSVANANAGVVWQRSARDLEVNNRHGQFARPYAYSVMGFSFTGNGTPSVGYSKFDRNGITLAGNLSWIANKTHSLKLGGELQTYTIRNYAPGGVLGLASSLNTVTTAKPNVNADSLKRVLLMTNGINNYGYDFFGNKTDDGMLAPHKPVYASAYITDKIEYQDLVLNIGLRYDYFNVDNKMMLDPAMPDYSIVKSTGELKDSGWVDVPTFSMISPRLGFSFPVTDRTMFHAQYGKFVQETRLADTYLGYYNIAYNLGAGSGYFYSNPTGNYLKPTRTTQYELGFTQQLTDNISVDVTGFYKDVKDQTVFFQQITAKQSQFKSYYTLQNGDFATTKGVELTFTMRRTERLQVNGMLAFQDAEGTGSYANSNRGIVGSPLDGVTPYYPKYISPLEYNNSLRGSLNLDYRFADGDGGSILENSGISLLMSYNSGHPFTLGESNQFIGEADGRFRSPLEPLNSSTTPSNFQVDLRIDKSVKLMEGLNANIYVQVINLFDKLNVQNVFLRTGTASDNGVISNPDLTGQLISTYGQQYIDFYRATYIDYAEAYQSTQLQTVPYMYGPPRQIRLGIRLEY